jgi:hypothetical protein
MHYAKKSQNSRSQFMKLVPLKPLKAEGKEETNVF